MAEHSARPSIGGIFTVSNNGNGIKLLDDGSGEDPRTIILNVYAKQARFDDDEEPFAPYSAKFRGRAAEILEDNIQEGDPIFLSGELYQTTTESGSNVYVNNQINRASFQFVGTGSDGADDEPTRDGPRRTRRGESSGSNRPQNGSQKGSQNGSRGGRSSQSGRRRSHGRRRR